MQPNTPNRCRSGVVVVIACLCLSRPVLAQTADSFNPSPNNQVFCMAVQPDDKIIVGGSFTFIAASSKPYLARLNPDGTRDTNFSATVSSSVTSIALQPDGKVLLTGNFTLVNGLTLTRLARLNTDGSVDTNFIASADNTVYSVALQADGKILVGGRFTKINGVTRVAIARLNSDGGLDSTFLPVLNGSPAFVNAVLVQADGKIVVGGSFTVGGFYPNLARFTSTGGTDPMPLTASTVYALAQQADGKLLVGTGGLTRIMTNTTVDSSFQPANISSVYCIQPLTDGSILMATSAGVVRVSANGVTDTNFNSFANSSAYALAVQADGKILAAGAFTSIAHSNRTYFARLNNPDAAGSFLTSDGSLSIQWLRSGAAAETQRVNFFMTTDGTNWTDLGAATRFGSGGWVLPNPSVRYAVQIRGRAFVSGGTYNGSSSQLDHTVATGAATITSQPASKTLSFGAVAQFAIIGGGTPATFRWYKDAIALTNDSRISGAQTPALVIANCSGLDSGNYSLVLSNSAGTVTSSNATLYVSDPVITSATNQSSSRVAGTTTAYSVSAIGTALTYQWSINGSPIASATKSNLILTNLTGANSGTYSAIVTSPFSSVTNVIVTLHVTDPYIAAPPATTVWNYGQTGTLPVTVAGMLPISYQWRKSGINIAGATTSALVVPNVQFADAGSYDVVVSNIFGTATSSVASVSINTAAVDDFNPGVGYQMDVYGLALDPANNLFVSGWVYPSQYTLTNIFWRLDRSGTTDTNFLPGRIEVTSIAVEPTGTILAGGGYFGFVRRLGLDGIADGTLGVDATGNGTYVWSLCQQPDGAIIAAGWFTNLANEPHTYVARMNPDNSFDHFFTAYADDAINTAALQPDGKILLGGFFAHVNGQPSSFIERLNSDGTSDLSFNGSAFELGSTAGVYCFAVQPDGKIIVGGLFTNLSGHTCTNLGRMNADGSYDATFSANARDMVNSLALQANGKIIVGGGFYTSLGSPVNGMALLDTNGTLDTTFRPNPNGEVRAIALQSDGNVIIAGLFTNVAGASRIGLARLINSTPATESWGFDGSTLSWLRGGSAPEVWRASFELSSDGVNWIPLGDGTRVNGGWQITGVPVVEPSVIRARGYYNTGNQNGSASITESLLTISADRTQPVIFVSTNASAALAQDSFRFSIIGQSGQLVAVDRSSDLMNWHAISTNLLSNIPLLFTDSLPSGETASFYRLRLP
jgi:uncharacterized delta-60 repeat protein